MLKAMGLQPYKRLHVHGYWNVDATKMSKSLGNVVRPRELVEAYGVDTVRYFVLREMSFGLDSSFSSEAILARHNSDLANDLGNLFSRSLTMIDKYAAGQIPVPGVTVDGKFAYTPEDEELWRAMSSMKVQYEECMGNFHFHKALQAIWEVIGHLNRYIVTNAPWELAKNPGQSDRLFTVLHNLAEALWKIAVVLGPIMPDTAKRMATALGMSKRYDDATLDEVTDRSELPPGTVIDKGTQLFPRIDKKAELPALSAGTQQGQKDPEPALAEGLISFDQFKAVELRVAEIVAAEKVAKSDRLLKLTVKAPEQRTIVAGIAQHYNPEDLVGHRVIIVANLKPAKLMGIPSQGMVLAAKEQLADGTEKLVVTTVAGPIAAGSRVA
jgi:methionyl-tRNA synthetase